MQKLSMEVRLLLAFLLMGVVMVISNYLMPPQQSAEQAKQAASAILGRPAGGFLFRSRHISSSFSRRGLSPSTRFRVDA